MKGKRNFSFNLKANPSRNVFDRSYRVNMTNNLGSLRPFFVKEVVAGSKVQLGVTNVTRVESLRGPSFARMHEHFDYFFVPFSQLWRPWEQFRTRQSHYNSDLQAKNQNNVMPTYVPTIKLTTLIDNICSRSSYTNAVNTLGLQTAQVESGSIKVNTFNQFGIEGRAERLMLLHLLGYGPYCPVSPPGTPTEENFDGQFQSVSEYAADDAPSFRVNLFRLAAYQKIYYDYYRNEKYESNRTDAYNLDSVSDSQQIEDNLSIIPFTQLQYRWKKKDYFMSVTPDILPSANYIGFEGFVNSALAGFGNTNTSGFYPSLSAIPNQTTNHSGYVRSYGDNGALSPNFAQSSLVDGDESGSLLLPNGLDSDTSPSNGSVSALSLKLMFAREQLLKRMYNAKNNYSAQMLAIFGFSPNTMRTDMVYHIGGASHRMIIDDVPLYNPAEIGTQTFRNGGLTTGKLRQFGEHQKCATFTAQEDGIVMGIHSVSIENDYSALGIERDNVKSNPEDYFYQEYENLGRSPLYGFELNALNNKSNSEKIIGFIDRYSEYKTSYDKVFLPFVRGMSDAVMNYKRYVAPTDLLFHNFTSAVENPPFIAMPYALYYQQMLINPNTLLDAVGTRYNGYSDTDPFIINLYNSFKCIAPMQQNSF